MRYGFSALEVSKNSLFYCIPTSYDEIFIIKFCPKFLKNNKHYSEDRLIKCKTSLNLLISQFMGYKMRERFFFMFDLSKHH